MELVLFCGLQGSGKTTFYRQRFASTHVHLSKDLWPNARRREQRLRRLLDEHLAAGRSVVVDNTSPTPADRVPLIAIARGHGARVVGYHFDAPLKECIARNNRREGRAKVPVPAILATYKRFVPPTAAEGYDALFRAQPKAGDFEVRPVRDGDTATA